ncbi:MAG: hypothetical protein WDM90_14515 [Ferruginibacter sp.]
MNTALYLTHKEFTKRLAWHYRCRRRKPMGEGSSREHAAMEPKAFGRKGCIGKIFCKDT